VFLLWFISDGPLSLLVQRKGRKRHAKRGFTSFGNLQMFALLDGSHFDSAPPARNRYHKARLHSAAAPIVNDEKAKKGASALFILQLYCLYLFAAFAIEAPRSVAPLGGEDSKGEGVSPPLWRVFFLWYALHTTIFSARAEKSGLRSNKKENVRLNRTVSVFILRCLRESPEILQWRRCGSRETAQRSLHT